MQQNKLMNDLTVGNLTPILFRFAIPVMISNLMQTAYNLVDMVIVGQFVGSVGLSSVSVGGDVMQFFIFVGLGFSIAGQTMVSQIVGAGKKKELNEIIGTLFSFIFLLGVVLSVIGIFVANPLLNVLNTPPAARKGAYEYTVCGIIGVVFIFGYNTVSAVLRGMGDSRHPMIFIGLASVMNILLDLLFIGVFNMEALGASLATVMSQGISFLLCLFYLYRHREEFGFDFRFNSFKIKKYPLKHILRLGIPVTLQTCAASISTLFVSSFLNPYGVVISAVSGVGNKLNSIALIVANAMNVSGASIIGQNFGAGKTGRVKQIVYRVFIIDFVFVAILSTCMLIFPKEIFSLFDSDPNVLSVAPLYAPVAVISFMGFAFRSPSLALINGLGHSKINLLMGIIEGILRIGLTYLLGVILSFGVNGLWYGTTIASYGYAIVVFPYFFSGAWKKSRTVVQK